MSLIIDAHEGGSVQNYDVLGANIHTSIPNNNHITMKFEGDFLNIMCDVSPKHNPNVRIEVTNEVLYMIVLKAI